ncbi:MAG TPA: vWA domain-containing protein [Phycisphaerae bacterium]|nr:vWA domain-containing protein [Phycisphaerae bacterium]
MARSKGGGCISFIIIGMVLLVFGVGRCGHSAKAPKLTANASRTDGTGVYILIDVSGSMQDAVPNATGVSEEKLAIAKRAAIDACKAIAKYADEDPKRNIRLAVASFSDDLMVDVPMGKPDAAAAERAINGLNTRGGTGIGDAVVEAQRALDKTGLRGQHVLVITDGENNKGPSPESVADAINALPEALRPTVYLVAFDINAGVFGGVKQKGWQVFSAPDGARLKEQLDEVVGGKILLEK